MRRYLYFIVFISGMTSLAAEFTAERILARVFGTSNLVWSAIIGVILVCLSIGYYLGGRWADRSPRYETLFGILAASAFMLGIVPFISNPILIAAASAFDRLQLGVVGGAFAAVLALFSVPSTLLAMASPFAIRLSISDPARAGDVSGRIYAVSTLGSFLGAVLPSVALIPLIGTTRTVLLFSGLLLLAATLGLILVRGKRAAPLLVLPLTLVVLTGQGGAPLKYTPGQIFETESAYNYIEVLEVNGYRMLG
jgi:MFS family permease